MLHCYTFQNRTSKKEVKTVFSFLHQVSQEMVKYFWAENPYLPLDQSTMTSGSSIGKHKWYCINEETFFEYVGI